MTWIEAVVLILSGMVVGFINTPSASVLIKLQVA